MKCEFCDRPGRKETASDVQQSTNTKDPVKFPNLLTWLYPDDKWICNHCLRVITKGVPVSIK